MPFPRSAFLRLRAAWLGSVPVLSLALASCYSFIGHYEDPQLTKIALLHQGEIVSYLHELGKQNVAAEIAGPSDWVVPTKKGPAKEPQALALVAQARADYEADVQPQHPETLLLRFGLMSDVHIHEPGVKLFSDRESKSLDPLIQSFERDPIQEAFQTAVFLATLRAFDTQNVATREPPRFLMHLGDAIDTGTLFELYQFVYLARMVRIPFLNVIGNHDDAIFGNYKSRLGYTKAAGPAFYPIANISSFLSLHSPRSRIGDPSPDEPPRPPRDLVQPTLYFRPPAYLQITHGSGPLQSPRGSPNAFPGCLGFDLNPTVRTEQRPNVCKRVAEEAAKPVPNPMFTLDSYCECTQGYYSHTVSAHDGTLIQILALDSTRKESWGQWGEMDQAQLDWLDRQLSETAPAIRLIFMHHRPHDSTGCTKTLTPLVKLLQRHAHASSPGDVRRPLVVFSGHTHSHETVFHEKDGYWEVNMGSLTEYPQWAAMVDLRRASNGTPYLTMRRLRPRLGQEQIQRKDNCELHVLLKNCRENVAAENPVGTGSACAQAPTALASAPAQSPCPSAVAPSPLSPDGDAYWEQQPLLVRAARCGFAGAVRDHRNLIQRKEYPQDEASAAQNTNVVLDLSR